MSVILDPGALIAMKQMSTDPAYSAMPNAPVVPDPLPGLGALRRSRVALAIALDVAAGWIRPTEPAAVCRPLSPGH